MALDAEGWEERDLRNVVPILTGSYGGDWDRRYLRCGLYREVSWSHLFPTSGLSSSLLLPFYVMRGAVLGRVVTGLRDVECTFVLCFGSGTLSRANVSERVRDLEAPWQP